MAQTYGTVDTGLWQHYTFRRLSRDAKLLFLYLKTCPAGNAAGLIPIGRGALGDATGLGPGELDAALDELAAGGDLGKAFALYDPLTEIAYLPGHLRHHPPAGRNWCVHVARSIVATPSACAWRREAAEALLMHASITPKYEQEIISIFKDIGTPTQPPYQPPAQAPHPTPTPPLGETNNYNYVVVKAELDSKGEPVDIGDNSAATHTEKAPADRTVRAARQCAPQRTAGSILDPWEKQAASTGDVVQGAFKPVAVYRVNGEHYAVPPEGSEHDKARMALAERLGVSLRGLDRKKGTAKLVRTLEALGATSQEAAGGA